MLKVSLINMPCAAIERPSIGLEQLASIVRQRFEGRVDIEVVYLNMDFARYLGAKYYTSIAKSMAHFVNGLGDWFFRQEAFPGVPDNTNLYFRRCYPHRTETNRLLRATIEQKRRGLNDWLTSAVSKYNLGDADIVGFTSLFHQNTASFALAKCLKRINPKIVTLMGGANCETSMGIEICRQVHAIDFVFSGPALRSFPTFLQHHLDAKFVECHKIDGVFSRCNCDFVKSGSLHPVDAESSKTVADHGADLSIDMAIPLNYGEFLEKLKREFPTQEPVLTFETSRGCWWGQKAHCTFCGLNGESMAYRAMQPSNAISLINNLFRFADKCTFFESVDNILPKHYVSDVLPFIKAPPNAVIFYEVKADLNEHDLEALSKAQVTHIQPGIEALTTPTLKLMKKGTTALQNVVFLKNCVTYGIRPSWNLLIGFPGDSEESYRKCFEDLPLLTHLFPPSGVHPVRFDRYSPYYVREQEYGLKLRPLDYYELIYPFDQQSLARLAYYFTDENTSASYSEVMTRWIYKLRERVLSWRNLWFDSSETLQPLPSRPELYIEADGSTIILDSRSGKWIKHDIGFSGRRVLDALNKPKTLATLEKEMEYQCDVAKEISVLREHGLLFNEGVHYLSLVHPKKPVIAYSTAFGGQKVGPSDVDQSDRLTAATCTPVSR